MDGRCDGIHSIGGNDEDPENDTSKPNLLRPVLHRFLVGSLGLGPKVVMSSAIGTRPARIAGYRPRFTNTRGILRRSRSSCAT